MTSHRHQASGICSLVVVLIAAAFSGALLASEPAFKLDDDAESIALEAESLQGVYKIIARPEHGFIPIGKMHRWIVHVMSADGEPVYPVRMSVGGGMAEHKHGLPTQPQLVAYGGDGIYMIDGVRFNMAGDWRLSFVIESEFGVDQVDFDIEVKF